MAAPRPEVAQAVGALLETDPARLVALASSLRARSCSIESTIEGMSMGRGLPPGCRIRIELINRDRYDHGEVIAFLDRSKVIVHRVVHRGRGGAAAGHVLTRGDATLVPDPPVQHVRILGPVTGVWREARWLAPDGAPRRSLRARSVARLLLWAAIGTFYLSPRATTGVLGLARRLEYALRAALARGSRRQASVSEPG